MKTLSNEFSPPAGAFRLDLSGLPRQFPRPVVDRLRTEPLNGSEQIRNPQRVDAAGRPIEGRVRQALIALGIVVTWIGLIILILWAHQGTEPMQPARVLAGVGLMTWAFAEILGGRNGPIWPISALGVTGSLSIGYAAGMVARTLSYTPDMTGIAVICGASALAMLAFLFRFRLPGLVSPVVTFSVVSLFLLLYGLDREGLSRVEGFSARGILAALMSNPAWAALFGALGAGAVILARRLDLKGDEFGLASARPLHLIGAGVTALVIGRILAALPWGLDAPALLACWILGWVWALRINRFAVLVAVHFAIAKPLMVALTAPFGWTSDLETWSIILTVALIFDMILWPMAHKASQQRNWTLGPGGRIPPDRPGWTWRYWPYA
ncbi:MAG: hypothetical protein AAGK00_07875 [Pseudomonadota bacterium]